MLKTIATLVVVAVAAILLIAASRPDTFQIARSTRIQAPPAAIFPLVDDLRRFGTWSPYENKDPAMKRAFSGPASGKGAVYEFDGNSQVGKGRLEIVESAPPSKVAIRLDMLEPLEGHNLVEFTLVPAGDATEVTWAMTGPMPFISKVMCLFIDMDRMVGTDFEAGLASLKATVERQEQ